MLFFLFFITEHDYKQSPEGTTEPDLFFANFFVSLFFLLYQKRDSIGENLKAPMEKQKQKEQREEDAKLLERIRQGENRAYVELISKYRLRLFRKANSLLGSPEDAEDILQETLITAFKAFHKFRGDSSIYVWLYTILVNKCRDQYRKKQRSLPADSLEDSGILLRDERMSAGKKIELSEDFEYLISKVNGLDDKFRQVIFLRYFDNLAYEEIATFLQVNVGTVRSRLFRARELLERAIGQDGKNEGYFEIG